MLLLMMVVMMTTFMFMMILMMAMAMTATYKVFCPQVKLIDPHTQA